MKTIEEIFHHYAKRYAYELNHDDVRQTVTIAKEASKELKELMLKVIGEIKEYDDVLYRRLRQKVEEL